ncbi:MAG: hypothetical protein MUF33_00840 [Candidatus Nanopelagicales bacterium]|nr:hypothetical protein [Candidatus Nanopelagicales bacterium]MCU0297044.1 hypothetical protein [Candidatus Nanopelagicales bacterium]
MNLDPLLLDVLACPCPRHAPVSEQDGAVVCSLCQAQFPIRDGIPVMLIDQATPGPSGVVGVADNS